MIALAVILAVALAGAIAAIVYLAKVAVDRADNAGKLAGDVGQRTGELELAAKKVTDANAATSAAAAAVHVQEQRGDALEKELTDDEAHPDRSALDRLQDTAAELAGAGPLSGSGQGRPQ